MFAKQLTRAGQILRFTIQDSSTGSGWELRVEDGDSVVRHARLTDWHRVERAMSAIEAEVSDLLGHGWQQADVVSR